VYDLWQPDFGTSKPPRATFDDGGFERGSFRVDEPFGWKTSKAPSATASVSIDKTEAHSGLYSLSIEWRGNPSPADEPVFQLLLVDPNTHYELHFVSRAHNLITGGAPLVRVTDVSGLDQLLARSPKLPLGNSEWQNFDVAFTTAKATCAIRIAIQREPCRESPCPIFGKLLLDDFSLQLQGDHNRHAE